MNSINSLNDKNFTLNGIQYFRNYVSAVHGNKIELYNCYERKDVLVSLTHFSEFTVNGSSYTSAAALQAALLDVTYSRLTGGDSSIIDQNNTGRTIDAGFVGPAPNYVPVYSVVAAVAEKLNAMEIVITAKETPVIITASLLADGPNGLSVTKIYKYLFKPGKGNWGQNGTTISTRHLEEITIRNYLIDDLLGQSNAVIENLGVVADGNFIAKANASNWNFYDLGTEGGAGQKTYYFSYETDDVLYFAQFTGTPGLYGISYTNKFTTNDFVSSTDSRITDVPNLEKILEQGGNKNISQLINNGDGTSPFTTEAAVNGLKVIVNQAAAEMYLKNSEGTILATVNLAFLNNEGTTFFYNDTTEKLELKNDAGEVLSQVPVNAFVSNLMHSVEFNGSNQSLLEFKDATGNIVDSVAVTINNIQGLQAALNTKANANGSNATGFWPIGVNSASTATQTEQFGGAYGDFLNDGNGITHVAGYDSTQTRVKRYTLSSFKLWLAMAITDISGLVTALANITASIGLKADKAGTLDTKVLDVPENTDLNTYLDTGLYLKRNNTGVTLELNYPIIQAGKLEVVRFSATQVYQAYHALGNNINQLFIRTLNGSAWQPWKLLANDAEVVHRTGSIVESINGAKTFTNPITYSSSTFDITIDNITGLSIIDKITAASGWSRMFRIADLTGATLGGVGIYGNGQNAIYGYLAVNANNHQGSILKFNSTGVGIGLAGTNSPTTALDVVGAAKFTGEVAVATATASGSAVNKSQLDSGLSSVANNVATNYVPSIGASTVGGTKTFTEAPVVPAGTLANHAVNKGQMDGLSSKYLTLNSNGGGLTQLGATADANSLNTMMGYGGSNVINFPTSGSILSMMFTDGMFGGQLHIAANSQSVTGGIRYRSRYSGVNSVWEQLAERSWVTAALATNANNIASSYVPSSGASTIGGAKTFTEAPTVPAGTLAVHAVNKAQLDLKADATSVVTTSTNQGSIGGDKTWIGAHTWDSNSNSLYQFKRKIDVAAQSFAAITAVAKTSAASQDGFGGGIAVQIESSSSNGVQTMASYRGARQGNDTSGAARVATYLNGVDTERLEVSPQGVTKPINGGTLQAPAAVLPQEVIIKSQLDSGLNTAANNVASNYIPSSGASTVNGTKTFTEAPVVPAGTLASHAINKGQLDEVTAGSILQGGNSFNTVMTIGTNNGYNLVLERGNVAKVDIGFAATTFADQVILNANIISGSNPQGSRISFGNASGTNVYFQSTNTVAHRFETNNGNASDVLRAKVGNTDVFGVTAAGRVWGANAQNANEYVALGQLDSAQATAANNVATNYIIKNGATTKSGTLTFIDAPIVPNATLGSHPINKSQLDAKVLDLETGFVIDNNYTGSSGWFSTLNAKYPSVRLGYTVYAIHTSGSFACKKLSSAEWVISPIAAVVTPA